MIERLRRRLDVVVLVALAYLPALLSSPGRMPADTKLYLYLNPGRQLSDSLNSWDTRQFAGWVPHQTVGYLWPSGPWFWTFDRLAIPDWVAHRLWIGTIVLAAGLGVRWVSRMFGLGTAAAFLAALVYQCSPYVLAYIGRTSVLLLPWAGLAWLFGHTVLATRHRGWRHPAYFALIIATVGGINATALAMIAPLPLVWIADAAARRELSWRAAIGTTLRLGGAALAASVWWLVPLAVQGRFGAQALAYSETLEAVSSTANATESLRGFGYWLSYVVDRGVPLTSASRLHQTNIVVVGASWIVILTGLCSLVFTRWRVRRVAVVSIVIAIVLAVGVHPIADSSPLTSAVAANSRSTWALALRSSTRALPVAILMLALGCGALFNVASSMRRLVSARRRRTFCMSFAVVVLANNPALILGRLVDPALDRSADLPPSYLAAAETLNGSPGSRVLQLPGAESGVFSWGTTVDPVLPGVIDRPVVQRDWLPLGSAAAMDLLYAFDDRFQDGTAEPLSVAPVARLLGTSSIAVFSDMTSQRFGTSDPAEAVATLSLPLSGLTPATVVGQGAGPNVTLFEVDGGAPVVRAKAISGTVIVVGSGAGVVDAAAAELIDGSEALLYAAALPASVAEGVPVIVTDTYRAQAHHWRGSQAVAGMTEGPGTAPSVVDIADHRMPIFPTGAMSDQTTAEQRGGLVVTASVYGSATEYHPESRPFAAVDGDPTTAWTIGAGHNPIGQTFTVTLPAALAPPDIATIPVRLVQPDGARRISAVDVGGIDTARRIELSGDDVIDMGRNRNNDFAITLTVAQMATGSAANSVGFSEVTVDGVASTDEVVVTPPFAAALIGESPVAYVLSRWRVGPAKHASGRSDPESTLVRSFSSTDTTLSVVATVRPRTAPIDPTTFGCRDDLVTLDGRSIPMRLQPLGQRDQWVDGFTAVLCDPLPVAVSAGEHIVRTTAASDVDVDRIVLTSPEWALPTAATISVSDLKQGRSTRHATVGPCPQGCWFILGEGHSDGWRASVDGRALGAPEMIDAGMAGWWLDPSTSAQRVSVTWPAQRLMWLGLLISLFTVFAAIVTLLRTRSRPDQECGVDPPTMRYHGVERLETRQVRRAAGGLLAVSALAALAIDPRGAMYVAVFGGLALISRRRWVGDGLGIGIVFYVAARMAWLTLRWSPAPGFAWPASFERLHRLTLVALFVLLSAALVDGDREPNR